MRQDGFNAIATLFEPQSVAVVGSLREARFGGHVTTKHLLDFGYKGKIFPVNPQYDSVLGLKVYPAMDQIPQRVDLAVVMTGAGAVPQIIEECVENRTRVVIIVSDGFAERHEDGAALQRQVDAIAGRAGIRLLGPNTIGVANPSVGLVTSPYRIMYDRMFSGSIAICGQTGLIGPQNLPLEETHYGVSKICDFGNKCDIDEIDVLDYLGRDDQTRVIALHLEQIRNGRAFLEKVREVVPRKAVLVLRPGKTEASKEAMASHTGSMAGDDLVYQGAFRQAGALRVDSLAELLDFARIFAYQPLPAGNRLAMITISGGAGVMGIDVAASRGLAVARLAPETLDKLAGISPVLASNPVDLGPALPVYTGGGLVTYFPAIVNALLDDPNVDCLAVACPWALRARLPDIFGHLVGKFPKTMAAWVPSPSVSGALEIERDLEIMGLPAFADGDTAIKALAMAYRYTLIRASFGAILPSP